MISILFPCLIIHVMIGMMTCFFGDKYGDEMLSYLFLWEFWIIRGLWRRLGKAVKYFRNN